MEISVIWSWKLKENIVTFQNTLCWYSFWKLFCFHFLLIADSFHPVFCIKKENNWKRNFFIGNHKKNYHRNVRNTPEKKNNGANEILLIKSRRYSMERNTEPDSHLWNFVSFILTCVLVLVPGHGRRLYSLPQWLSEEGHQLLPRPGISLATVEIIIYSASYSKSISEHIGYSS